MTPIVQNATDLLSFLTVLADILAVFLFVLLTTRFRDHGWGKRASAFFGRYAVLFSFIISVGGVVGSLFYSEFAHFGPAYCVGSSADSFIPRRDIHHRHARAERRTCAAIRKLREKLRSSSGAGFIVSAYHSWLQLGGGSLFPCSATGVSCEFVYFMEYGYVTIPMMALTTFADPFHDLP